MSSQVTQVETSGLLTKTGEVNGLIIATCGGCSYPAVLIPSESWGKLLGCVNCHSKETERLDNLEHLRRKDEEKAREKEEDRRKRINMYFNPHLEQCTKDELANLKGLAFSRAIVGDFNFPFTANKVSEVFMGGGRLSPREAYNRIIGPLLDLNLLEQPGVKYGDITTTYESKVDPTGRFKVRDCVKEVLLKEKVAKEAPAPKVKETPSTPDTALTDFIKEECMKGEWWSYIAILRAEYVQWCQGKGVEPSSVEDFIQELRSMGYAVGEEGSKNERKLMGLRLLSSKEKLASSKAGA